MITATTYLCVFEDAVRGGGPTSGVAPYAALGGGRASSPSLIGRRPRASIFSARVFTNYRTVAPISALRDSSASACAVGRGAAGPYPAPWNLYIWRACKLYIRFTLLTGAHRPWSQGSGRIGRAPANAPAAHL